MKRLIGLLLSIALLAGLLAGCAGAPAESNDTSTPGATDTNGATAQAAWPRTYTDDLGHDVVIEKQPERVAVLHFGYMEWTSVLGVTPIASTEATATIDEWSTLQTLKNKQVADLGESPNLEKLLELSPDLIIMSSYFHADMYDDLQKIAPTLAVKAPESGEWYDELREWAKVLGKEEEAERIITELYARMEKVKEQLSDYRDYTFLQISATDAKTFGFSSAIYGILCDDLGLKKPEGTPDGWEMGTMESLAALDPDYLLIANCYDEFLDESASSSVWNTLKAVKGEHLVYLPIEALTGGPLGIGVILDTLENSVIK
jgi:iron complex transport system substrate-binding protein